MGGGIWGHEAEGGRGRKRETRPWGQISMGAMGRDRCDLNRNPRDLMPQPGMALENNLCRLMP